MGRMKRYHWFGAPGWGGSGTPPKPQSSERVQWFEGEAVEEVVLLGQGQKISVVVSWMPVMLCMQGP